MKTLLMAIDRQATMAEKVINVTLEQAKAHQASVIILCCVAPDDAACSQPIEIDTAEKNALSMDALDSRNSAEQIVRYALNPFAEAGIPARGMICSGDPATTIVEQADRLNVSMIIMGRRHLSSFNRILKGSVSAAVLERAHCPVLVDVSREPSPSV
ncbi:hypothetical protein GCM10009414_21440 [Tatumella terrea]|uniref:Universal stress protein n=1 Tax=Tatumella terrea TaxID=419007 RepID=A0ABW1VYL4_9GAMM|nr:universal stress protein [Tatumella sp. JGM118]MBS0909135.1 universal stress protein [Tatumella sp. JGM118]